MIALPAVLGIQDWITAIAAAVTALSTTVLVLVTWRYVRLTRELARGPATPSIHIVLEGDGSLALYNVGGAIVNFRGEIRLEPRLPDARALTHQVEFREIRSGDAVSVPPPPRSGGLNEVPMNEVMVSATYAMVVLTGHGEIRGGRRFPVRREVALAPRNRDVSVGPWVAEA